MVQRREEVAGCDRIHTHLACRVGQVVGQPLGKHIFYSLAHREFVLEHTGPQNVHYRRARLLSIHHEAKETIIEQHTDILEAIRANDRERLQNAIFTHLNNVNVVMQGPNMGDHALYFNPPYEVSK